MSEAPAHDLPRMDRALLARLTGGLGDQQTVAKISAEFGSLYSEFLPDVFHSETGFHVSVGYIGCESGLMSDLVAGLGDNFALANTSLRNWSPNFVLALGNGFVMTLMEHMLGALPETIDEPIERSLSNIELDLATVILERVASVLRSGVNAAGGFEALMEPLHNAADRPKADDDHVDEFGASIRMSIELGSVVSEFALVIPQKALLKTVVVAPKSKGQLSKNRKEWADRITDQVHRSHITLEARIRLQPLTLRTISKLAAGDVIAFQDKTDVQVDVSANGKDMYSCEFGRSGERYTVRVRDNMTTDDEILKHLMG